MENDENIDLKTDDASDVASERKDNRFKDLSDKVKSTSEERDKLATEKAEAEKERDFFKGFSNQVAKYPAAAELQDKILEKVKAGYEVEDATVAILNREGKLTPQPQAKPGSPAGGSATNTMKGGGEKPLGEMTRDEKRAQLVESEKRGDISMN